MQDKTWEMYLRVKGIVARADLMPKDRMDQQYHQIVHYLSAAPFDVGCIFANGCSVLYFYTSHSLRTASQQPTNHADILEVSWSNPVLLVSTHESHLTAASATHKESLWSRKSIDQWPSIRQIYINSILILFDFLSKLVLIYEL